MTKLITSQLKLYLKELEETGKFPKGLDGDEIGQILDFHNQNTKDEHRHEREKEIHQRNKYYWKLAVWATLHPGEPYESTGTILVPGEENDE